jgi:Ca-activated chloride channel family protein
MFEFVWPYVFLIVPLPLLVYFFAPKKNQGETAALLVPNYLSVNNSTTTKRTTNRAKLGFAALVWLLLVTAAARPQWLGEPISIPSEGRDLMIALDLSGSMRFGDMTLNRRPVTRLDMTKYLLSDFVERRVGDRLGLILFADSAYLQAPLTYDRDTIKTYLDETVLRLIGDRTAIGDAIGLAVKRYEEKETSNRVLVLLTDGQNTAGNLRPELAKELALNENVTIYTIGVGSFRGAQDLDEALLTDLAKSTGGRYFRAHSTEEMQNIYKELDLLEPIEGEAQTLRPLTALFFLPLMVALALIFIYSLVQAFIQTRTGRVSHD